MMTRICLLTLIIISLLACTEQTDSYRFTHVKASRSGIDFENRIVENDSVNVIDFQYTYNGGGVGIGDFNNDGLPDVVFGGNQVSSKVYINQGRLQFKDISKQSGLVTHSWVTGISIVDINADGWDDIYLNVGGANCQLDCNNLLYINQGTNKKGIPTFKEMATSYGLDDGNYSQQTVFFDYDGDGDLDAYILHNGNTGFDKNNPIPKKYISQNLKDQLLRNDSDLEIGHPKFTNISKQAGITHGGFGLGLGIHDFNDDGLIDIYVANDFITEDLLYIQKRHLDSVSPWFEESSKIYLSHESHNAMGMDAADINNDGLTDILVLDMLPKDYGRQKRMLGVMNYEKYLLSLRNNYNSQYVRNTLQIGNGFLDGQPIKASEVSFMKGVSGTDWSWSPLMIDLDNDSDKDIYISNGYVKDVSNLDYINFSSQGNMFGSREERIKKQVSFVNSLDSIYLPNFIYENTGAAKFSDVSATWTKEISSYSNGVAYADFDQDGDLDLVVNNINAPAFLLENNTSDDKTKHFLRVRLNGDNANKNAVGARITVWNKGKMQKHFQSVIRGYLSSVEPIVHFGVKTKDIDSLEVLWPNGKRTFLEQVKANELIQLNITDASTIEEVKNRNKKTLFANYSKILPYKHEENPYNEYNSQRLLMRQYSRSGPAMAMANIDGVPGDEVFIGGSKGHPGQIWSPNDMGTYTIQQVLEASYEDTDAVFVDIDTDGDLDLFVTSGSSDFLAQSENYQDRLYFNDGYGNFKRDVTALPTYFESSSCVRPADFDQDGDIDFFVGSSIIPGRYPQIPESSILLNENGRFTRKKLSPDLKNIGMVTDAIWRDVDGDGWEDLVLVGQWMPISIIKNHKGQLKLMDVAWIDENKNTVPVSGWWNCVKSADFDGDGDYDFILGNQGTNGFINPTAGRPVYIYAKDYDNNGSIDPVLSQYYDTDKGPGLMPVQNRDDIVAQLPILKKKYLTYDSYANVDFKKLLSIENIEKETLNAYLLESSYAENLGNGSFKISALPEACQVSTINDILLDDIDKDGMMDAFLVGNENSAELIYGKFDAFTGILLKGSAQGFEVIPSKDSGFYVPGQSNTIITGTNKSGEAVIMAGQNSDSLLIFRKKKR